MSIQTVTSETLADFNAARMAPHTPEPQEEAPKEKKEEAIVADEAEVIPDEEHKEEKPKKGLAKRFSELTTARDTERQAREAAESRAKAAEAELAALRGDKPKAVQVDPDVGPKPDPKEYTDAFEYAEDLSEWTANKVLKDRDIAEAKAKEEAKRGETLKAWQTRLESAKARIPDFEATVASSQIAFGDVVRDAIIESEYGPEVLHHFADNDDEAEKLNGMTVKEALKYLGRLEARFEAGEKKEAVKPEEKPELKVIERPVKKLAAPIEGIKASNASSDPVNDPGEFKGTFAQWKAHRLSKRG